MAVAWFLVCPRKDYKNYYAQGKKTIWTTIVYCDCHWYRILYCIHHEICLKLLIVLSVLLGVTVSVNALVAFVAQVERYDSRPVQRISRLSEGGIRAGKVTRLKNCLRCASKGRQKGDWHFSKQALQALCTLISQLCKK